MHDVVTPSDALLRLPITAQESSCILISSGRYATLTSDRADPALRQNAYKKGTDFSDFRKNKEMRSCGAPDSHV